MSVISPLSSDSQTVSKQTSPLQISRAGGGKEVLVFGYGNPSRGDDALGPLLLSRLEAETAEKGWCHLELMTDFQLQVEHALDLRRRHLVLFVDACVASEPPFRFEEIEARRDSSYTSHAMSPQAVLAVCRETLGEVPPPCFLLSIRGARFELGEAPTATARDHLDQASRFATALCAEPDIAVWRRAARAPADPVDPRPSPRHA